MENEIVFPTELRRFKTPKLRWTPTQRRTILILDRWYANSFRDFATLFNVMFRGDLLFWGFFKEGHGANGITRQALHSQSYQMMRDGSIYYKEVYEQLSFPQMTNIFAELYWKIQLTACEQRVKLVRRSSDTLRSEPTQISRKRAKSVDSTSSGTATLIGDLSDSEGDAPKPPRKMNSEQKHTQKPGRYLADRDTLPPLCFRAFSSASAGTNGPGGFASGALVTGQHLRQGDILDHASKHLSRDKAFQSPLISLTPSFIWAWCKAKRMQVEEGCEASIAVISIAAIENTTYTGGEIVGKVVAAGKQSWAWEYRGTYECFVWESIPSKAILRCINLQELEDLVVQKPMIGKLLQSDKISALKRLRAVRNEFEVPKFDELPILMEALGEVIRFMKPNVFLRDPFITNFARIIIQNFRLHDNIDIWKEDPVLRSTLERAIHGPEHVDALRAHPSSESSNGAGLKTPPATPQKPANGTIKGEMPEAVKARL